MMTRADGIALLVAAALHGLLAAALLRPKPKARGRSGVEVDIRRRHAEPPRAPLRPPAPPIAERPRRAPRKVTRAPAAPPPPNRAPPAPPAAPPPRPIFGV